MEREKTIDSIIKKISEFNKIALFHHVNPDGDSISCSYGLLHAIKAKFPSKEVILVGDYNYLQEQFKYINFDSNLIRTEIDNDFLVIAGDVVPGPRLAFNEEYSKGKYKINFDHHYQTDLANVDIFWHEPEYPASTMQAYEISKKLNIKFNEEIAFLLMIGLLTDTGHFTYSLANPKPPEYYSELLQYISDDKMNKYFNMSRQRTMDDIKIQKIIFKNLKVSGNVAFVKIKWSLINKYSKKQYYWKIHSIGNIQNYPIWVFFLEVKNSSDQKNWHVHFRSNGPNVQSVAKKFGGGGHIRAAGAKVKTNNEIKGILFELNKL